MRWYYQLKSSYYLSSSFHFECCCNIDDSFSHAIESANFKYHDLTLVSTKHESIWTTESDKEKNS